MAKNLLVTLSWDKSYTLLVAPVSGRFAVDQNHVGFELRPATTTDIGGIIVGDNLVVTDEGRLSATGSGVAGVASFNNRVGNVELTEKDVSDALGFRPVNYKLPIATEQTLGGVKQGKNVAIAEDGTISVPEMPTPYQLPIASKETLGGVKVGRNLSVDEDGTLNASDSPAAGVTAFNGRKGDVKLTKKDVTDVVDIPKPYDLPVASEQTLGGIKVGRNLEVSNDGTLDALDQTYTLPPATDKTLGGIIVGDNLTVDDKGRLSATGGEGGVVSFNGRSGRVDLTTEDVEAVQLIATKASLGVMMVGKGLTVQTDGSVDVDPSDLPVADNEGNLGVVKVAPNGKGSICINEFDETMALCVVAENICLEGKGIKTQGGGIVPYGDSNLLCLLPATKDHMGGFIVGHGLTIQPDTDQREACLDVNVDGETITINEDDNLTVTVADNDGALGVVKYVPNGDGTIGVEEDNGYSVVITENLLAEGGCLYTDGDNKICVDVDGKTIKINGNGELEAIPSAAGVKSFNGRTGDVKLTKQDVTDVAPLTPATDKALGGIKVGSGLSVTQDGTLSATGGGGGASLKIVLPSANSYNGELNGLGVNGRGLGCRGIDVRMNNDPLYPFKNARCMRADSYQTDADTVVNVVGMIESNGSLCVWKQKNPSSAGQLKPDAIGGYTTLAQGLVADRFDMKRYVIDANTDRLCAFAIDNNGNLVAYSVNYRYDGASLYVVVEDPVISPLKAADKNIRVAVIETTDKQKVWAFLYYWTSAGLVATAFDMKNRTFVGKETLIAGTQGGGGNIVLCSGGGKMFVTARPFASWVVPCYASEIGVIAPASVSGSPTTYEVAEMKWDNTNNALMCFYFYGADGQQKGEPTQAAADMFIVDRRGYLHRMSDPVLLNFWAFVKNQSGGSVSFGISKSGNRYVWTLRNPNGQISAAAFSVSGDYVIRSLGDCVIGSDMFTRNTDFAGLVMPWGIERFTLFAVGSTDGATTCQVLNMPTISADNNIGYGVDYNGTILTKGMWVVPTAMQNLSAGEKYYVRLLNGIATNKTGYELTTDATSGIYAGVALDKKTLLL